ncbi:division/outer membrane stress-associated lipid-binding lipoprotein [Candidatus Profftia sp. (ex Adelges kitamiensis)]|uniref:division/outer membrane stress-associated lipid-binding lipoprotein n=1 Tax=Candidatus Profftia sp. (ex Adelges kitamiensis) TaxID=2864218 RepID=UPI001CE2E524|nr:division/outer membrane stress-associated lipid-binding lipoprotein [Candidatus Profftia sp. (ex Adelges kitamiensis)]
MIKYSLINKYFLLLFVIIGVLFLQGCMAATVIGGAVVATQTAIDPRSLGTQIDDHTLESRIYNAIDKNKQLKQEARIIITVYQGDVLLTGQVVSSDLISYAENTVMNIASRSEIYSEIRTGTPINIIAISKDYWITTKIRFKMLINTIIKSPNIKVVTEDGEVFLLGLVTLSESKEAAKIASQVSGVKHVTTVFNILNKKM